MDSRINKEAGHYGLSFITMFAAIGLIVLAYGAVESNPTMIWAGAIIAAVLFIVQFGLVHAEFGKFYGRIDTLEREVETLKQT
jgi:membrane protein YdbS with pleckstrin-like domain